MGGGEGTDNSCVRCQLENDKVTSERALFRSLFLSQVMKMEIGIGSETDNCKWH